MNKSTLANELAVSPILVVAKAETGYRQCQKVEMQVQ